MFTLKCVRYPADSLDEAEFFETPAFVKQRIIADTGHVTIVVSGTFGGAGEDLQVSEMEEDWQEIFVMNSAGVTIERIKAEARIRVANVLIGVTEPGPPNLVRDDNAADLFCIIFNDLVGKNVDNESPWMPIDPNAYGYEWDKTEREGYKLFHYLFVPMRQPDGIPAVDPEGLERALKHECDRDEVVTFIRFGVE